MIDDGGMRTEDTRAAAEGGGERAGYGADGVRGKADAVGGAGKRSAAPGRMLPGWGLPAAAALRAPGRKTSVDRRPAIGTAANDGAAAPSAPLGKARSATEKGRPSGSGHANGGKGRRVPAPRQKRKKGDAAAPPYAVFPGVFCRAESRAAHGSTPEPPAVGAAAAALPLIAMLAARPEFFNFPCSA